MDDKSPANVKGPVYEHDSQPRSLVPPPYSTSFPTADLPSTSHVPVSFTTVPLPPVTLPLIFHMIGSKHSPSFTITAHSSQPHSYSASYVKSNLNLLLRFKPPPPLFTTTSTCSYLSPRTSITDHRPSPSHPDGRTYTLFRRIISDDAAGEKWRYTIPAPASENENNPGNAWNYLLEMDTTARILYEGKGNETILKFRRAGDGEVDGAVLRNTWSDAEGRVMEILRQGEILGRVRRAGKDGKKDKDENENENEKKPAFEIRLEMQDVDPILMVILVLAVDDRVMSDRRRAGGEGAIVEGLKGSVWEVGRRDGGVVAGGGLVVLAAGGGG